MKYYFSSPQRTCALNNGLTRCFFNEEVKTETVTYTDPETEETRTEEQTTYCYDAVDLPTPVEYGVLVDALVRVQYSQSAVEAIMRHKIAGAEGSEEAFAIFNAFAEACKVEANRILEE
jgi:hypothetical protein